MYCSVEILSLAFRIRRTASAAPASTTLFPATTIWWIPQTDISSDKATLQFSQRRSPLLPGIIRTHLPAALVRASC
jgi:hypothetical protein